MSNLGAFLEIPQIGGKLLLPPNESKIHVGKRELKRSGTKPLADPNGFNSVSSVRKDAGGNVIKEQFIISNNNGQYNIQDLHSTNGTYLGSAALKQVGVQPLKDGDSIVIPIEENGSLVQLTMIFRIAKSAADMVDPNQPAQNQSSAYQTPQYSSPSGAIPQASLPSSSSAPSGQYYDPTPVHQTGPTAGSGVGSVAIQKNASLPNAQYHDPDDDDYDDSSASFIVTHSQNTIPADAFAPNSGLDLSMVYKLEKSELWHIAVAFGLIVLMVYHTYLNVGIIIFIISYFSETPLQTWSQIFLDPLFLAVIFGFSFVVHELAHLNTGKHFGFQSRFCLTKVGLKSTKKAAIIGVPFGLPGAAVSVGVDVQRDVDKMGWIKFAGPCSNLVLGLIFMIGSYFVPVATNWLRMGMIQGAQLNFVLGAFNMIPKEVKGFAMDGKYIISWKKNIYIALLLVLILGYVLAMMMVGSYQTEYYQYMVDQQLAGL